MTKTFLLLLYFLYGFQLAAQVLVSADVAQGLSRRARWTAWRTLRLGGIVAAVAAVTISAGREFIVGTLTRDPEVVAAFAGLAPPAAAMLLMYGALWVLDGVLYGLQDYAWSARCTTAAAALAIMSMILLGGRAGAPGIWWSLNLMMAIRLVAASYRVFLDPASPLSVKRRGDGSDDMN